MRTNTQIKATFFHLSRWAVNALAVYSTGPVCALEAVSKSERGGAPDVYAQDLHCGCATLALYVIRVRMGECYGIHNVTDAAEKLYHGTSGIHTNGTLFLNCSITQSFDLQLLVLRSTPIQGSMRARLLHTP